MVEKIPTNCVIAGEAYAVWEAEIPNTTVPIMTDELDMAQAAEYNTVTLYRPVNVDVNGDGDAYAFMFVDYDHPGARDDGKLFVDPGHVHRSPPKKSHPAYKFGVDAPGDTIDPEDVPEDF